MRRNYKRNSSHSGFLHCYDSLFLIMKSLLTDIGDCCIKYIRRRVKTSLTGILDNSDDETNTDCLHGNVIRHSKKAAGHRNQK